MPNQITAPPRDIPAPQNTHTTNTRAYPQEENKALHVDHARNQFKVGILESALEVSIHAGNNPQALLFRTAIDRINEMLGTTTAGPDAIQKVASQDNSPEATANTIVSSITGLFAAYSAKHPDTPPEQVAKDFVDAVRGGVEKGANDAKDILKGLNVLDGNVESGIAKTYDLVQKGLDTFLSNQLKPKDDTSAPQAPASAAT